MGKHSDAFMKTLTSAIRQHGLPNRTKASQAWFQDQAKAVEFLNKKEFIRDQTGRPKVTPSKIQIGDMIMFNYDAKYKDELPVWDRYPLIFPFNVQPDRFYGINMHYLPHAPRAKLMDALETIKTDNRYSDTTKINLNYKLLKQIAKAELYEPTIHCYLKRRVKSKVKVVLPIEWHYTLFLKLAIFAGQDRDEVFKHQGFQ